jgi:putative membrane protein
MMTNWVLQLAAPPIAAATELLAADTGGLITMDTLVNHILAAVVFSIAGVIAFGASLWIMNRLSPFSLRKEIEEDQNSAVAVIIGSMILGIAIIIASAIHG